MAKPASGSTVDTEHALAASMVNCWAFLEGSGSTSADSVVASSNTATLDGASWTTESGDNCLSNSTAADAAPVTLASPVTLDGAGDWTIAWRAKATTADNNGMVCGDKSDTNDFVWGNGSQIQFRNSAGTTQALTRGDQTTLHDYVLTYTQSTNTLELYVDGSSITSANPSGTSTILIDAIMGGYSTDFAHVGTYHYLMLWSGRALSSGDVSTFYSDPYAMLEAPVVDAITLTAPTANQVIQRGSDGTASFTVTGTYTGTPTAIEYNMGAGGWMTLDDSPSGGTFSESVTFNQGVQNTFSVRFSNDTDVNDSATMVGCGDVFAIYGQSNASGRGNNNQSYSGSWQASQYTDDGWVELTDPFNDSSKQLPSVSGDGSAAGHWVHAFVSKYMEFTGVPVGVMVVAAGGLSITALIPGADHDDQTTRYGCLKTHAEDIGAKAVLYWQGETDAIAQMSQSVYNGHLDDIADSLDTDLGIPLIPCLLQNSSGITDADEQEIRDAVTEAVGDNTNVLQGPDFSAMGSDDAYHFTTDGNLTTAGEAWATAVNTVLPTTTGGIGPGTDLWKTLGDLAAQAGFELRKV